MRIGRWRMMERKKSAGTRQAAINGTASTSDSVIVAPPQEAAEPQPQPFQWQTGVEQSVQSFWDTSMVPSSATTEFTTSAVQDAESTVHFCACPFHGQPDKGHMFCGIPFSHHPLDLPSIQQDGSADGSQPQTSCNYDPQLPPELNAAFNMPLPSDPQRSSLSMDTQSNGFYSMTFAADTNESSGVMPSADPVTLNTDSYNQIRADDDPRHGNEMEIDAPIHDTSQESGQVESAGASPSPPRPADQETEDRPSTNDPRPARSYYRTPAEKVKSTPPKTRHVVRDGHPPRLSSTLTATNE